MENMQDIADAMSRLNAAQHEIASERFDKEALVHQHQIAARSHTHLRAEMAAGNLVTSYMTVADGPPRASLVALQNLRPIRLGELNVGCTHRGRVLFGTLCVNPFKIIGIMTVLQDDQGLAVRVAVYNVAAYASTPAALEANYPKGARVAIKEPYFKQAVDGGLAIRIENPANLVRVAEVSQHNPPPIGVVDLEEERGKGNECFRKQDWRGALIHYTNCISAPNNGEAARKTLSLAYSNRAETHLQMGEFEQALEDSNKSLQIDPGNLKTLFRKGRALRGLEDYAQVCQVLQTALQLSPGQADIDGALRQSKAACARSRQGEYDISGFLLGMQPPAQVGDFIGDVEIQKTGDGRGRGLYATKNISTGKLFLVSNAIAIDNRAGRPLKFVQSHQRESSSSQEDLVAAIVGAANKSQKLLRQLYALDDGSGQIRASIPAMDLFDTNSRRQENPEAMLQLDVQRIRDIASRNSFGGEVEPYAEVGKLFSKKSFSGLWLLPSFVNHSCLPNATRLNVGRAMFLHAVKPIKKGEEITISYFDALLPLPQREAMCDAWGFNCNCKRCTLEKSLNTALVRLNAQFEALHDIALEEVNAARSSGQQLPADLPKSAEFAEVYKKLDRILAKRHRMKEEEKNWVRASYVTAYWVGMQSNEFVTKTLKDTIPDANEILRAVVSTVPGDLRTLAMVAHKLEGVKGWIGDEGLVNLCAIQARDICVRVLGKHSEHIINALISRHAK